MSTVTRTSELEAVNTMLDCIGESPINTLETAGIVSVDKAKSTLSEISRTVQESGWYFNRDTDWPLLRDSNGKLAVPADALRIDATREFDDYEVVQRGGFLYSKKNRSFVFDKDLKADIVWILPWDDLPESARRYILIRAARVFQSRQLGSDTQHKFSEAEELQAYASMNSAEGEVGDFNVLNGSYSVAQILER